MNEDLWYFQNDEEVPNSFVKHQELLHHYRRFRPLPKYECRACGEHFHSDNLKQASRYDHSIGAFDTPQPICFDCAKKVDTWDWRVY